VAGHARVGDYAVAKARSTIQDEARLLEHATLASRKTCGDHVVVKGIANVYGGNQSGTAVLDGYYAKGNEISKGKWFTWSWGQGKNPGEVEEDFGGLYADYDFEKEHPWMAYDAFGVTWGCLVNAPKFQRVAEREKKRGTLSKPEAPGGQVLVLDGRTQCVELTKDVADMRDCTYTVEIRWDSGDNGARIFEFANPNGDAVWLSPSENGRLVFAIRKGTAIQQISAPALRKGVWATVRVILAEKYAMLYVDGNKAAETDTLTLTPESVRATQCYLGRGLNGGFFGGMVDRFTIHSVALVDHTPPRPNPATFEMPPDKSLIGEGPAKSLSHPR
jgi:hypothetical protein